MSGEEIALNPIKLRSGKLVYSNPLEQFAAHIQRNFLKSKIKIKAEKSGLVKSESKMAEQLSQRDSEDNGNEDRRGERLSDNESIEAGTTRQRQQLLEADERRETYRWAAAMRNSARHTRSSNRSRVHMNKLASINIRLHFQQAELVTQ